MIRNRTRDGPRIPSWTPPRFKAPFGNNPVQKAGTIHFSYPEHLLVFEALHVDDPEQNAKAINVCNPEQFLIFKAASGDNA